MNTGMRPKGRASQGACYASLKWPTGLLNLRAGRSALAVYSASAIHRRRRASWSRSWLELARDSDAGACFPSRGTGRSPRPSARETRRRHAPDSRAGRRCGAYECAYGLGSVGCSSLRFDDCLEVAVCSQFPLPAVRCCRLGRTLNPKVVGSIPTRPIQEIPANRRCMDIRDMLTAGIGLGLPN